MPKSKKKPVVEAQPDFQSVPEKQSKFLFPASNGRKRVVIEAKNLDEAKEKYKTL